MFSFKLKLRNFKQNEFILINRLQELGIANRSAEKCMEKLNAYEFVLIST